MPRVFLDDRAFCDCTDDLCSFSLPEREIIVRSDDDLMQELEDIEAVFQLWTRRKYPGVYLR